MAVTLAEVAAVCRVSTSTVSRALGDPGKVNPQTRKRIEKVARDLGYTPSRAARSLVSGRTETISLLVPDIANPFFPPIMKAVQARARGKGYSVLLADSDEHAADEFELGRGLARQSDGLILASPRTGDGDLTRLAAQAPLILINREIADIGSVVIDESQGMREAVEHLVALGHRKICYLAGPRRSWSNQQRRTALTVACTDLGIALTEVGPFEPQIQSGMRAADLAVSSDATAAIAYDDLIALGMMARLTEFGMLTGREISLIGIDDSPMSTVAHPMLTSIHVPAAELGSSAVDLLMDRLRAGDAPVGPRTMTLETTLVIRASTGPVSARRG